MSRTGESSPWSSNSISGDGDGPKASGDGSTVRGRGDGENDGNGLPAFRTCTMLQILRVGNGAKLMGRFPSVRRVAYEQKANGLVLGMTAKSK